jgi:phosphatidylinositol dimannoside acyltransferase
VTSGEPRLEAPHRRLDPGPRVLERATIVAYRATAWLLSVLPTGLSRRVIGRSAQASYLFWPRKRRWSNRNFGHVLGLSPDDPRVRRLALAAYYEYGRYLVELMRLPSLPPDHVADLVHALDIEGIFEAWRGSRGGLIFAVGHVGNNEAVAAAVARHGMPISVVADDSSFPELFELLRRQRESWGVHVIAWRNLREIYMILKRREMLALLVDWGYRADGIPVRLFDGWTALPAGPATLAAKTGSRILSIMIARTADGRFDVSFPDLIEVRSNDPAELQRATQRMADALAATVVRAPEQWYSFKPIWPATAEESADLERRARAMQAGQPDPGPAARGRAGTDGAELAARSA